MSAYDPRGRSEEQLYADGIMALPNFFGNGSSDPYASRLGGLPMLNKDEDWPAPRFHPEAQRENFRPVFLGQIRLSDLPNDAPARSLLPATGRLSFYTDPLVHSLGLQVITFEPDEKAGTLATPPEDFETEYTRDFIGDFHSLLLGLSDPPGPVVMPVIPLKFMTTAQRIADWQSTKPDAPSWEWLEAEFYDRATPAAPTRLIETPINHPTLALLYVQRLKEYYEGAVRSVAAAERREKIEELKQIVSKPPGFWGRLFGIKQIPIPDLTKEPLEIDLEAQNLIDRLEAAQQHLSQPGADLPEDWHELQATANHHFSELEEPSHRDNTLPVDQLAFCAAEMAHRGIHVDAALLSELSENIAAFNQRCMAFIASGPVTLGECFSGKSAVEHVTEFDLTDGPDDPILLEQNWCNLLRMLQRMPDGHFGNAIMSFSIPYDDLKSLRFDRAYANCH
ncbi:MAG: hypothetical protein Alpg2KO_06780 [Alphaproteobacteria bacterium]